MSKGNENFAKQMADTVDEHFKNLVEEFISSEEVRSIFFMRQGDKFTASHELPSVKKKAVYFIKSSEMDAKTKEYKVQEIHVESFDADIITGELTEAHLRSLELLTQEVYFPLLSNPANRGSWSGPTAKEVMLKFSNFLATVTMTAGEAKGQTILPLPPPEAFDEDNVPEKERIGLLETSVVLWTERVHATLQNSPESMALPGEFPDPLREIKFWESQSADLKSLINQLASPQMENVVNIMTDLKSTMVSSFTDLAGDVAIAQAESEENVRFLQVLHPQFVILRDETDPQMLNKTYYPLFQKMLLIWKHSATYNTQPRLICLVHEICNALISAFAKFVSGENIFRQIQEDNIGEIRQQMQATIDSCNHFKDVFSRFKVLADAQLPEGAWDVPTEDLFVRLELFIERCDDMLEFTNIVAEFHKLDRICLGGTKGKTLTDMINGETQSVFTDFLAAVETFKGVGYDCMDITKSEFDDDFYRYRLQIKSLERRLSAILTLGFDDCATLFSHFKLLESFDGLLQRPIIKDDLDKKRSLLLRIYSDDLSQVQQIFHDNKRNPPLENNMPPVAGRIMWCRGLLHRDIDPFEKLEFFTEGVNEQEFLEVKKMHQAITTQLQDYEAEQLEAWTKDVDSVSEEKLNMPLLRRDSDNHFVVNFDDELVCLLREVRYLILLDVEVIPSAMEVYEKAEQYRTQITSLEYTSYMYNFMHDELHPVERPLVAARITDIDEFAAKGMSDLNWINPDVNEFIDALLNKVKAVYDTVVVMKANFEEIKKLMNDYSKISLIERKSKPQSPKDFGENLKKHLAVRHESIREIQEQCKKLLDQTRTVLNADLVSPTWRTYQEHVQDEIKEGLSKTIVNSIQFLEDNMNDAIIEKKELKPLLEVGLDFWVSDVIIVTEDPTTANDDLKARPKGRRDVWSIVSDWVESFFQIGYIMTRMDSSNYVSDLKKGEDIVRCMNKLKSTLETNSKKTEEYRQQFLRFDSLWTKDKQTEFKNFLASTRNQEIKEDDEEEFLDDEETRQEEAEMADAEEEEEEPPRLDMFEQKIEDLKRVGVEISEMADDNTIGWLKVNAVAIKASLINKVNEWMMVYTNYLYSEATRKLTHLETLINEVKEGLASAPEPGDSDGLKSVLENIYKFRSKSASVEKMFEPLRESKDLLKKYGRELSDYDNKLLADGNRMWQDTAGIVDAMKTKVNILQNQETAFVEDQVREFALRILAFRSEFSTEAPFQYKIHVDDAYDRIFDYHQRIGVEEKEAAKLNDQELVFELPVTKPTILRQCRSQNKLLKQVWDMICLVKHQFDYWKRTLWDVIDVDMLTAATKGIQRQVNEMSAEVKGWPCYMGLKDEVKNFLTVLPMISALHSPYMKDRHWERLKDVTKKQFVKDHNFCLANILDLQLHKHLQDVEFIVDLANKESKIGASLASISKMWSVTELEFKDHPQHQGLKLLTGTDETLLFLQEHMGNLQAMQNQGAYVQHFIVEVTRWLHALLNSENVLQTWLEVQHKWNSLEAIFLGSADIRAKLPDDTDRFITIDTDFKELMAAVVSTPNVIEACTAEGRAKALSTMMAGLEQCERSLNQYLETKRRRFPRFYFLSNASLLDILSNGHTPQNVQKHLGDCFDNIKTLTYVAEEGSEPGPDQKFSRVATHMNSKEGAEHVPFSQEFHALGNAEDWLGNLVVCMKDTLKFDLDRAKTAADGWDSQLEARREDWIRQYCAQVALTASQIVWTEEVEQHFDGLAEGNEQAMKEYSKGPMHQRLSTLVDQVLDLHLTKEVRTKIITIITVDVHNRDVVQSLIDTKTMEKTAFAWQRQLRYAWNPLIKECTILVADAKFYYSYEYIGNTGRLVITPLTDRCYITLTQALRLIMGGAPAGPAGTGKTETTKDLGRGMGLPVYVFNCSEQMNTTSLGLVYKGLAMTGSWGCFDEFNRIPIEVLSVVATQVADILNAIKADKKEFSFMGESITLVDTVGVFITMNPGYAGRTELPENLKALFRSCAMVVPDMDLICENMLMSEGFQQANRLAKKFTTLYSLSSELLSKQKHYDWGLRATKAVLRVAGGMKRGDMTSAIALGKQPSVEDAILMRALRDFNTPKLVADDKPIFNRLCFDLFPEFKDVKRVVNMDVQRTVETECAPLQKEPEFVRKCVELDELLGIRHSVFIIGPPGAAKSETWKTLQKAYKAMGDEVFYEVINPKAVKNKQLYGWLTNEWNDGILSNIMRNMSRNEDRYNEDMKNKWIILDGDIDPEWIESLNTVMDDNKVLTLVSNERIPLGPEMRLIFEVADLKEATPATVSRAGIMYINQGDVGWKPFLDSWVESRAKIAPFESEADEKSAKYADEKKEYDKLVSLKGKEISLLMTLTIKYCTPEALNECQQFYRSVPVSQMNMIKTMCFLLEGLLEQYADFKKKTNATKSDQDEKTIFEAIFVFCCVWAYGGACPEKYKSFEPRKDFSAWWKGLFPQPIKFPVVPKDCTVFDFVVNFNDGSFEHWSQRLEAFNSPFNPSQLKNQFVPTVDTLRVEYVLDLLVDNQHACMLVGTAGTGKTMLVKKYLRKKTEMYLNAVINLNFFTDAGALQAIMEGPLKKHHGSTYGPPIPKRLIYMIDDLNLPAVDIYGTQSPSAFVIHHMYYGAWYDTSTLLAKTVVNCQYIAALNPTAGSFNVHPRYQGQFATFAVPLPDNSSLTTVYGQLLTQHFSSFPAALRECCESITKATLEVHQQVRETFVSSTLKFHYQFNMRDLSNIFQGICNITPRSRFDKVKLIRLWRHECLRVFSDRFRTLEDIDDFLNKILNKKTESTFRAEAKDVMMNPEAYERKKKGLEEKKDSKTDEPLPEMFFSWMTSNPSYVPVPSMKKLKTVLERSLQAYNEQFVTMDLELFGMACEHILRIVRIIEQPNGNAMLVGVGGSGKQSLSKLASYIIGSDVFQISVSSTYQVADLKNDLQELYRKAGVKALPVTFLLTDAQIVDDRWLVFINDILSSGYIHGLFPEEDEDAIFDSLRNAAKAEDVPDDRDSMEEFFLRRVRTNLHLVLCFSPVGDDFRKRCMKFPALISCTSIDWFHPWPKEALVKVANRFLSTVDLGNKSYQALLAAHMAEVHASVDQISKDFKEQEGRHNYTTPKSFLELIAFFKSYLAVKRGALEAQTERLENGIRVLQHTQGTVEELKKNLTVKLDLVRDKTEKTEELIKAAGKQKDIVEREAAIANVQKAEAKVISDRAASIKAEAKVILDEAEPKLQAAKDAVDSLESSMLTEMKTYNPPGPGQTIWVARAIIILLRGSIKNNDSDWATLKSKFMGSIPQFKATLQNLDVTDEKQVDAKIINKLDAIVVKNEMDPATLVNASKAAANLGMFVRYSVEYYHTFQQVDPLQKRAAEADAEYDAAQVSLAKVEEKVRVLTQKVDALFKKLNAAAEEKKAVEAEAAEGKNKLKLAGRLVGGLASENKRWGEAIEKFKIDERNLVGDVMMASSFVSYIGAFNAKFRSILWKDIWLKDLEAKEVSMTENFDPLHVLATESDRAKWRNEGLASDRISQENGALVTQCTRWPLMIDPQLQGIKWINNRVEELKTIQLNQPEWVKVIKLALAQGQSVMIENAPEDLDATLDPVLSRAITKVGYDKIIKMGSDEISYDDKFQLYIQTKLTNPHYRPEVAAQCTFINFIVTEQGLQDQLLALVVNKEKPELERTRSALVRQINEFQVTLNELENELLSKLSNAPKDILSDESLIVGLEQTKEAAADIEVKKVTALSQNEAISIARAKFDNVAAEGSWLFFMIIQLNSIDHMYQFSLDAFNAFFHKAMVKAQPAATIPERVELLRKSIRLTIFTWVNRGLFVVHKPILLSQLCFLLMKKDKEAVDLALQEEKKAVRALANVADFDQKQFDYLIRGPPVKAVDVEVEEDKKLDWLKPAQRGAIQALADYEGFEKLFNDMQSSPNRFKDWFFLGRPESKALPLEWRKLDDGKTKTHNPFMKLLIIRALRIDRMTTALIDFVAATLPDGKSYTESDSGKSFLDVFHYSLEDASPYNPIFFILSPGTDPVSAVVDTAKKLQFYEHKFHRVALGEGQDVKAIAALKKAHKEGHWVVLENIHLMPKWNPVLEKQLDDFDAEQASHEDFRVFLSAEPSLGIPIGILERSIKLTNEPPQGLKQNLKRAFASFDAEEFEQQEQKVKQITFVLCHFHAIIIERQKFGSKGWNRPYPFNEGDLKNSFSVLVNYLEAAGDKIPWADIRYMFGEILYGGHITDDLDRLLCSTYLEFYMREELLDDMELFPYAESYPLETFRSPAVLPRDEYFRFIDERLPPESPVAFGLHGNAEIAVKSTEANTLFRSILLLQPRSAGAGGGAGGGMAYVVRDAMSNILTEIKAVNYQVGAIKAGIDAESLGPYQNVFLQECERMNILCWAMKNSLEELTQGMDGELQMSGPMEELQNSLFLKEVPTSWANLAYPSLRGLDGWMINLRNRLDQIDAWLEDPISIPKVVNIALFFNPQSFLTAIMQKYAQMTNSELDKLVISTNPTRKDREHTDSAARSGAYVDGMYLEGARWNWNSLMLEECQPREMFCAMPVVGCHAILVDKMDKSGVYYCPVFKTQTRGPTYVFTANLRSKLPASKWILGGVVMVLEADV
jgi:dynein heavy chain